MYKYNITNDRKVLFLEISGALDFDEGNRISNELKNYMENYDIIDYTFIVNGKDVILPAFIMGIVIQRLMQSCYEIPFKKVHFIGNELQLTYARNILNANKAAYKNIELHSGMDEITY